ncbi:hypothetical protein V5N11_012558 [Cardamine amara subsp. amara]|uniref:CCHC-type domain-containing protein n=1 Tax=Cardamine amara subsp. amara TaxID=228776 RepID=A0ABD0ZPT7_CARAN
MLSKGTKDLDKILSFGRTCNVNRGLGYNGVSISSIKRVSCNSCQKSGQTYVHNNLEGRVSGCWFCGKFGHVKTQCYRFLNRVKLVIRHKKYQRDGRRFNQVWIKKHDLFFHDAYTTDEPDNASGDIPLYFDSGYCKHLRDV